MTTDEAGETEKEKKTWAILGSGIYKGRIVLGGELYSQGCHPNKRGKQVEFPDSEMPRFRCLSVSLSLSL